MTPVTGKTELKRPSKGQRKHNRRVKQEARKAGISVTDAKKRNRPA